MYEIRDPGGVLDRLEHVGMTVRAYATIHQGRPGVVTIGPDPDRIGGFSLSIEGHHLRARFGRHDTGGMVTNYIDHVLGFLPRRVRRWPGGPGSAAAPPGPCDAS